MSVATSLVQYLLRDVDDGKVMEYRFLWDGKGKRRQFLLQCMWLDEPEVASRASRFCISDEFSINGSRIMRSWHCDLELDEDGDGAALKGFTSIDGTDRKLVLQFDDKDDIDFPSLTVTQPEKDVKTKLLRLSSKMIVDRWSSFPN